jgi:drug/metabolite transporter (DMT)-like permease
LRLVRDATDHQPGRQDPLLGVAASAAAAVGWGSAGVLASETSPSGVVLTFWRTWLGAVLLSIGLVTRGRYLTWRTLRVSLLGGLLLGADMSLFFSSLKLSGVAVPTVIGALQPALVMVLARPVLGERIDRSSVLWTVVAIAGVLVTALGGGAPSHHELLGDLLAVLSLLAWSGYFIAAKYAQPMIGALDYTAGVTTIAAVGTTVVVLVARQSVTAIRAGDWLWIALLAVVPSGAHLLMNVAQGHLDVSISSLIGSSNPIVAAVGAYLFLNQSLDPVQIAGGVVGLVAISVVAVRRSQPIASPAE